MADGTKIEWTDATLNVINGCSVISPGCTNCYAMRSGARGLPGHPSTGLTKPSKAGHVWTNEVRFNEKALLLPLRWRRPRTIFWNAHGDLFHDSVPDEWIDRCFAVMALTPHHSHQVLTKRSARMRAYMADPATPRRVWDAACERRDTLYALAQQGATWGGEAPWPLLNVWLGVSVEDQTRADERIPDLLATPAAVRFLSCEPLLGPVDISWTEVCRPNLDWVIIGGESGTGARPMHPDWARSLRDQCADAIVPFLFKQWGEWLPWEPGCPPEWEAQNGRREDHHALLPHDIDADPRWDDGIWAVPEHAHFAFQRVGKTAAGRLLDGVHHDGFPG